MEHVFAACQTDGDEEIPEPIRPTLLTGEGPRGAWDALAQLVEARGLTIERGAICFLPTARLRWCLTSSRLLIACTPRQQSRRWHTSSLTFSSTPTRAATTTPTVDAARSRPRASLTWSAAELGLETDGYSFPDVANVADGEVKVLTATADRAARMRSRNPRAARAGPGTRRSLKFGPERWERSPARHRLRARKCKSHETE